MWNTSNLDELAQKAIESTSNPMSTIETNPPTDTGNLPSWPGAAYCYSKAYKILAALARRNGSYRGYPMPSMRTRRSDSVIVCTPDMQELITALNQGDEEQIKWLNFRHEALILPARQASTGSTAPGKA